MIRVEDWSSSLHDSTSKKLKSFTNKGESRISALTCFQFIQVLATFVFRDPLEVAVEAMGFRIHIFVVRYCNAANSPVKI